MANEVTSLFKKSDDGLYKLEITPEFTLTIRMVQTSNSMNYKYQILRKNGRKIAAHGNIAKMPNQETAFRKVLEMARLYFHDHAATNLRAKDSVEQILKGRTE